MRVSFESMEMKKLINSILLILLIQQATAQSCIIHAVKMLPQSNFYNSKDSVISYPLIVTPDTNVSNRINEEINNRIFLSRDTVVPIREMLQAATEDGLGIMDYHETYNANGILSLSVFVEWCAAYCSQSTLYFNFDLNTGDVITLESMVKPDFLESLKAKIHKDKYDTLINYKIEMRQLLQQNEVDSDSYEWALNEVNDYCIDSLYLENFSITGSFIEVADYCELPHAIRALAPFYELKYNYAYLEKYLRKEYLSKLHLQTK